MENDYISDEIDSVEHYLGALLPLPAGVCIGDTHTVVCGALGYEISDLRRARDPKCVTAFEYLARIEWGPWHDGAWRLMYALYRRAAGHRPAMSNTVEEMERRPLLEMPIALQRYAHHYLPQLVTAAGGEGPLLRGTVAMTRRMLAARRPLPDRRSGASGAPTGSRDTPDRRTESR